MISSIQMNLVFPSCPSVLIQSGFFDLRPSGNKSPNTCLNYLCCWSHPRKLKTRQSSQINKSTSEPLGTLEHFGAVSSNLPSCCKTFFSDLYRLGNSLYLYRFVLGILRVYGIPFLFSLCCLGSLGNVRQGTVESSVAGQTHSKPKMQCFLGSVQVWRAAVGG